MYHNMALASSSILKSQTPLQQLLEEINFQRTKEMRQLLKDDSGFVVLQGTTYWTDLFVRHFLFQSEPVHNIDSDDLLFFVRKKHVKGSSRHMPKFETEVDVYRKDSRKLPIGDPDVDWEETVYLNMVIHQFDYTLTLAICTRTSPKELQVLRRHSQRVYASPSRRKMDTKGEGEEMTYPHICFMVDNFDEVFSDILVRDGEMVCVELVASDKDGSVQGVIFLGSIRYDALKKVYDARQSSLSSKVAQRMTFGLFSSGAGPQTRCEFVRMKGPQGKGHAEMAVTKPKGSGIETPTSEPGFCATDMWDEWDDEGEDFYCRHQRRLSDPSANLNNFTRYGWRTKHGDGAGAKARSENEGLDSLASEVSEIEAGDLRDDRPASSASETKLNATTPTCCNCFGPKCKRWSDTGSEQMSDVYCRACEEETEEEQDASSNNDSPACLSKIPSNRNKPKHRNLLNIENELVFSGTKGNKKSQPKTTKKDGNNKSLTNFKKDKKLSNVNNKNESNRNKNTKKKLFKNSNKNDLNTNSSNKNISKKNNNEQNKIEEEYELADDATSLNGEIVSGEEDGKIGFLSEKESKLLISVHGKEELPAEQTSTVEISRNNFSFKKCVPVETKNHPLEADESAAIDNNDVDYNESEQKSCDDDVINKCVNYRCPKRNNEKNDENQKEQREPLLHNHHHYQHCQHHHHYHTHDSSNKTHDADGDLNGNNNISNNNCCTSSNSSFNGVGNNFLKKNDERKMSTLPKVHKKTNSSVHQNFYNKALRMVPKITTPDGTNIYYWCDLPKKALKELDDGAYNPLWATRGFTQTFHFWKENRRQQSTPLNAFLTYVTLPWWSIAKDLLDHRETPILTF